LSVGNIVPNSTKSAANSITQLFTRNAASRESHESSSLRAFSSGSRQITSEKLKVRITTMKPMNSRARIGSSPNACTDWTTPERVMKVPKTVRKNVTMTSVTFQTRSMLRRSWTITECRNAVAVNHGSSAAFSTGSHAQYPPQPSSSYAQIMPRNNPIDRNSQANIVQRRTARSHESSRSPVISAAMPNANGIVMPTKPMYSDGGWIAM